MINQSYITGYINALDNLKKLTQHRLAYLRKEGRQPYYLPHIYHIRRQELLTTLKSIRNVKNEYRALVKSLNQSGKC